MNKDLHDYEFKIERTEVEQEAFLFLKSLSDSIHASRSTPIVLDIYGDAVDMIIERDEKIREEYAEKIKTLRKALQDSTDQPYAMNTSPVHDGSWVEPRSSTTTERIALNSAVLKATDPNV